ncbi:MAG TPA: acyl--CoA ligase [Firmicutes bacterium]|jgi:long-chain acyl-CoA synthetase|nr:acyl--CoA ligase [Bacillota bacterium]
MNISKMVETHALRNPDRDAVIAEDIVLSWKDFNLKINCLGSALLQLGVKKGDRVALYLPNSPEYLISYFAVTRIGAVVVPLNIMYKSTEIKYIINNSRASIFIAPAKEVRENILGILDQLPTIRHLIVIGEEIEDTLDFSQLIHDNNNYSLETLDCAPDDIVTIMYTSGTTGTPKGAVLTHSNFWEQARLMAHYVLHINDQDRFLPATPFTHIFFVFGVLGPIYKGAAIVILPRFFPDKALEWISKFKVTHFCGVPTMYIQMLHHYNENKEKYNLHSWRFAQSAGAAMPEELISQVEANFGVGYCECYGSTETSTTCTYERLGHVKPGSIGLPPHNWQVKIVDDFNREVPLGEVGEILVKGPGLFKEYWEMPEETAAAFTDDGWFHTEDLAYADKDGYMYMVGRKKEMIICGGYNIYPREIEDLLYTHPAVLEAAVIGIPDETRGEIPKAFIALNSKMQVDADEIISFCKNRIAAYKVPRIVEFVSELPKSATGKILKQKLL